MTEWLSTPVYGRGFFLVWTAICGLSGYFFARVGAQIRERQRLAKRRSNFDEGEIVMTDGVKLRVVEVIEPSPDESEGK